MSIVIEAKPVEQIKVELVGVEYLITPPKAALALGMAVDEDGEEPDPTELIKLLMHWVDIAFGEQAGAIRARLDEPSDLLDVSHLMLLMQAVIEEISAVPTT